MFPCKIFHNNCHSIVENIGCSMLFKEPPKKKNQFLILQKIHLLKNYVYEISTFNDFCETFMKEVSFVFEF